MLEIARRLFKTEAEVLYRLKHPQIPELFAHFEENGEFYLVEDYIDGDDLSKTELTPGKRLREPDVIKLLQGILEVLAFVHQQNVIHRDINPKNLIRRKQDGKLFLIDFGAVKEIQTQLTLAQGQTTATLIGTRGYMPSEQASGHPQLSSDVYAVGIIGIQALTGIQPSLLQKDDKTWEVIWRNQSQVSTGLADILDKMVRHDCTQRYPSAVEALQAIAPSTNTSSTNVSLPITTVSPPRKIWLRTTAFMGLVGGLFVGLVFLSNHFSSSPPPQPRNQLANNLFTYANSEYKIQLKYPQDWEKQENPNVYTQ